MKNLIGVLTVGFAVAIAPGALADSPAAPPPWAYPVNPPGVQPAPDDGTPRHVAGSSASFSLTRIRDLFNPPDWHPADHPPMPDIVAHGAKPGVFACGYCHLPNGLGRPENASLAGLPAVYLIQQLADFKSGARKSAEPRSLPASLMVTVAKAVSEADVKAAAEYFSSLPRTPWIRVVEADRVPQTKVAGWMLVSSEPGATEPIGHRIVEMPEDLARTELRDSASGFVAYVPVGSIAEGEALTTTGGAGKTIACAICHGADLRGLGPIPGLAGRSPSYIVRQLYDIQHGVRNGTWTDLMKPVVARLTEEDMVAIAAYAASRAP